MKSRFYLAAVFIIFLGSCKNPFWNIEQYNHVCSFDNWTEITAPTCIARGIETGTCSCGETDTRLGENELGHDWNEWEGETPPTCAEPSSGKVTRECKRNNCDEIEENNEPIAPLGCDDGDWHITEEPTCTEDGEKELRCTRCDESLETETIDKHEHIMEATENVITPPTCIDDGVGELECTREGCEHTVAGGVIPADPDKHDWDDYEQTTEPTCKTPGIKTRDCLLCGETDTETQDGDPINDDAHEWNVYIQTTEPTCVKPGIKTRDCKLCGEIDMEEQEGNPIDDDAHDWDEWTPNAIPATCTQSNKDTATCKNTGCNIINERSGNIDALGHNFNGSWSIAGKVIKICLNGNCSEIHSIGDEFVQITGGTFTMGQTGIATPTREVTLTGFKMSKFQVTQELY